MSRRVRVANIASYTNTWPYIQMAMLLSGCDVRVALPHLRSGDGLQPVDDDFCGMAQWSEHNKIGHVRLMTGRESVDWAIKGSDVVYVDSGTSARVLARVGRLAPNALYASKTAAHIEHHRELGKQFCVGLGYQVTNTMRRPLTLEQLEELDHDQFPNGLVVKLPEMTLLINDRTELIDLLPVIRAHQSYLKADYSLSVEPNIATPNSFECCFGGYFDGSSFLPMLVLSSEAKRAHDLTMPRLLSGESGTTNIVLRPNDAPHLWEVLIRAAPALASIGHRGYVDFNCMVGQNGHARVMEQTIRPGYPTEIELFHMLVTHGRKSGDDRLLADVLLAMSGHDIDLSRRLPHGECQVSIAVQAAHVGMPASAMDVNLPGIVVRDPTGTSRQPVRPQLIPGEATVDVEGNPKSTFWTRTAYSIGYSKLRSRSVGEAMTLAESASTTALTRVKAWGHVHRQHVVPQQLTLEKMEKSIGRWRSDSLHYEVDTRATLHEWLDGDKEKIEQVAQSMHLLATTCFARHEVRSSINCWDAIVEKNYEVALVRCDGYLVAMLIADLKKGEISDVCVAHGHRRAIGGTKTSLVSGMMLPALTTALESRHNFDIDGMFFDFNPSLTDYYTGLEWSTELGRYTTGKPTRRGRIVRAHVQTMVQSRTKTRRRK